MNLAVIIPALNEERRVASAVRSAIDAGASEIVVVDGGSSDATCLHAQEAGARVLSCTPPRALQSNTGARATAAEALVFLHADSRLPAAARDTIAQHLSAGVVLGGFRIRFTESSPRLRIAESMINLRTAFTRQPWGDQGQFLLREQFQRLGGYREIPIMEDYDLAVRASREGLTAIASETVETSGRRFLEKGVFKTAWINWRIIIDYHRGVPPEELAARYRKKR